MKKFIIIFVAAAVFFSFCSVGFASGLVTDKPGSGSGSSLNISSAAVLDFCLDFVDSISESFAKRTEAARCYYFYTIINDKYNSSCAVFDSSVGYKFSDDILRFYFDEYMYAEIVEDKFDTDGDIYLASAGFSTPFSLSLLNFYAKSLSGSVDSTHSKEFEKFKSYYNTMLARYVLEQGGQAEDPNPGQSGMDIAPGYVTSEEFNEYIEYANTLTTPKGKDLFIQSYRSENFWHLNKTTDYIPIFNDSKKTQFNDLYFIPFCQDENGVQYYGQYQYHLYYVSIDDPNADVSLRCDSYKYTPGLGNVLQSANNFFEDFAEFEIPFCLGLRYDGTWLACYDTEGYSNCKNFRQNVYFLGGHSSSAGPAPVYYSSLSEEFDSLKFFWQDNQMIFCYPYDKTKAQPNEDAGFICSHSLIERTYTDIDTSKIPSNQVINITGDTIYDYSITNPETGQTSTINNYITNNYNYPALPTTSGGGSGGVGGDVNVTGSIGVHGDVGVDVTVSVPDININVNQGNGAGENGGGTAINPDDFMDGSSVDLDKYYDDAVSQASGVRAFMSQFFDFLPAEIIGLICMLVAVAIVCRIFGR